MQETLLITQLKDSYFQEGKKETKIIRFKIQAYKEIKFIAPLLRTAVAQWLRCCATNRKVAGSIPAGVSGFFDRTMALGSTQPLTEMSTRSISWG